MSSAQTISAVATRTGFSASALRFYEGVGLVTPQRTAAGYRVYDERAVARLEFIARAKQLGLTLDEITDLVGLWDADRCAPVATRLQELVDEKLGATRARIADLERFAADLERFQGELAGPLATGACDDQCPCADAPVRPITLVRADAQHTMRRGRR